MLDLSEHVHYSGPMGRRFSSLRTGPKLAQRLARVELGQLSDDDLLDYLHAQARQLAFQQGELWRTMAELDRRVPGGLTDDGAAHEIAAELRISRLSAERELDSGGVGALGAAVGRGPAGG